MIRSFVRDILLGVVFADLVTFLGIGRTIGFLIEVGAVFADLFLADKLLTKLFHGIDFPFLKGLFPFFLDGSLIGLGIVLPGLFVFIPLGINTGKNSSGTFRD